MNLVTIGETTLNMERVNAILDNQVSDHPDASPGHRVVRILFDDGVIELAGSDAQAFRRWVRHNSRNLAAKKNADGETLLSPEDQLLQISESLVDLLDEARFIEGPRNKDQTSIVRRLVRRLAGVIEGYITGQLKPEPARLFERLTE